MSVVHLDLLRRGRIAALAVMFAFLAACASDPSSVLSSQIQAGQTAYTTFAAPPADGTQNDYKISAFDALDITIFQEPDLSAKALQVDATGNISLPLVGSVPAVGKTSAQLSADIAQRLGVRYLKNPQVSVVVATSASQKVTVEGEVTEPGVYDLKGTTTLLQTLALAKGETRSAKLNQVVVFRNVNGERMGAVFDVAAIRTGKAADPAILGNDVVVVGFSKARRMWNDILSSMPIIGLFRPILPVL